MGNMAQRPDFASQPSIVQGFPSLQTMSTPLHSTFLQMSPLVHLLPSSHPPPSAMATAAQAPVAIVQLSMVQLFPSSQLLGTLTQLPPLHASTVHLLASSQGAPSSAMAVHWPLRAMQLSLVQGFLSSHVMTLAGVQAAALQVSPLVHADPSSHGVPSTAVAWAHRPVAATQLSIVQRFASSQPVALPAHKPLAHTSLTVHALPSSQFI